MSGPLITWIGSDSAITSIWWSAVTMQQEKSLAVLRTVDLAVRKRVLVIFRTTPSILFVITARVTTSRRALESDPISAHRLGGERGGSARVRTEGEDDQAAARRTLGRRARVEDDCRE